MNGLKRRVVMLIIPLAVILLTSVLAAQGQPNPCANACWQAYLSAVRGCHGDAACLAAARAQAETCVKGCGLPPKAQQ